MNEKEFTKKNLNKLTKKDLYMKTLEAFWNGDDDLPVLRLKGFTYKNQLNVLDVWNKMLEKDGYRAIYNVEITLVPVGQTDEEHKNNESLN